MAVAGPKCYQTKACRAILRRNIIEEAPGGAPVFVSEQSGFRTLDEARSVFNDVNFVLSFCQGHNPATTVATTTGDVWRGFYTDSSFRLTYITLYAGYDAARKCYTTRMRVPARPQAAEYSPLTPLPQPTRATAQQQPRPGNAPVPAPAPPATGEQALDKALPMFIESAGNGFKDIAGEKLPQGTASKTAVKGYNRPVIQSDTLRIVLTPFTASPGLYEDQPASLDKTVRRLMAGWKRLELPTMLEGVKTNQVLYTKGARSVAICLRKDPAGKPQYAWALEVR